MCLETLRAKCMHEQEVVIALESQGNFKIPKTLESENSLLFLTLPFVSLKTENLNGADYLAIYKFPHY